MTAKLISQWCLKYLLPVGLTLITSLGLGDIALAGGYVSIDKANKVELYYEEAGEGQPVVFVPGWTGTSKFFSRQLDHFKDSKSTRFIVFDPRAQGRSTKTLEGANYIQHAHDLKHFIDELGVKDIVLGGWSWGGITVYTYLSLYGSENIKGLVVIDQTPKPLPAGDGSWTDGGADVAKGFFDAFVSDRIATAKDFIPWMFTNSISEQEAQWMLAETMMTSDIVASQLLYDGWMFDHTETVKNTSIPQLYFVREENSEPAKAFLKEYSPNADIVVMGGHGMHYDHAPEFNKALDDFLTKLE